MEVIKQTSLRELRRLQSEALEKQRQIDELSKAKDEIEQKFLDLMDVSAVLYEENITLKEQHLASMEAIAEIYELMLGGQ